MQVSDLVTELEKQYPDTLQGVMNEKDLIARKAEQDMIGYIKILNDPNPKKKDK